MEANATVKQNVKTEYTDTEPDRMLRFTRTNSQCLSLQHNIHC